MVSFMVHGSVQFTITGLPTYARAKNNMEEIRWNQLVTRQLQPLRECHQSGYLTLAVDERHDVGSSDSSGCR